MRLGGSRDRYARGRFVATSLCGCRKACRQAARRRRNALVKQNFSELKGCFDVVIWCGLKKAVARS